MKDKNKIESFFKTANTSWWNPASTYDNRSWFFGKQLEYIRRHLIKRVTTISNSSALDAGCGRGVHSELLASLGCVVTSLDLNREMLQLTNDLCDTRLVEGSIMDMPFDPESFDIILSVGTTMHVLSVDTMMSEIERVIRKNGIAIISIANKFSLYVLWTTRLNADLVRHQGRYHRRQFSFWEFRDIALRHGFVVLDSTGFAVVPPISLKVGWRWNIIPPLLSRIMSKPFDWILGKYFGCGVTFVLKKM